MGDEIITLYYSPTPTPSPFTHASHSFCICHYSYIIILFSSFKNIYIIITTYHWFTWYTLAISFLPHSFLFSLHLIIVFSFAYIFFYIYFTNSTPDPLPVFCLHFNPLSHTGILSCPFFFLFLEENLSALAFSIGTGQILGFSLPPSCMATLCPDPLFFFFFFLTSSF